MNEAKIQFHGKPGTIPQDLCRAKNITAEAKTIFALLTTYKEAYPGQEWIADHVPCSEPTVRSRLRELELHGWLRRDRRNRRAKETDLYHVYLSKPLPVGQRSEWVKGLELSAKDIQSLPKGDYGKEITVIPLRKRAFPKRVEGSEVGSSSDDGTPNSPSPRMNGDDLTRLTEHYATIREARPRGKAWLPIQQGFRQMVVVEEYSVDDIIGCMDRIVELGWNWTIKTVRTWIADYAAGKMPSKNGDNPKEQERLAQAHDPSIYDQGRIGGKR